MPQEIYYRQCIMTQETDMGEKRIVTWIPEKGAVVGHTMKIKAHYGDDWLPGIWTCSAAGEIRRSEAEVKRRAAAWRKYRENTDV